MSIPNRNQGPALTCLVAPLLCAGCGAGVAAVVASSGSSGGGNSAPSIANLQVPVSRTSPAEIRFELSDREGESVRVELRTRVMENGVLGDPQILTQVSGPGFPANGAEVQIPGGNQIETFAVGWQFTGESFLPPDGRFLEGMQLIASLSSGTELVLGDDEPFSIGNDAPVVRSVDPMPTDPLDPGESTGNVEIRLHISDSSSDLVDITVEWRRASDPPDVWSLATAAGVFPAGVETSPDPGVELSFFWNTNVDLADEEDAVFFRVTADDRTDPSVSFETQTPFRIDNNAAPIATLPFVSAVADRRRGIPVPFQVFDPESDRVRLVFQWRRPSEMFPALPPDLAGLLSILEDPEQRRALHIATEMPPTFTGRPEASPPSVADRLVLPELAGPASAAVTRGLVERELEILRPSFPSAPEWRENPLSNPVAAVPLGDGLAALVLDGLAALVLDGRARQGWRLREIELATGAVRADVASGVGTAGALALERGGLSVLVAFSPSGSEADWTVDRVGLSGSAETVTRLAELDTDVPTPLRDIASLGNDVALITLGDTLTRLSFPPGGPATTSVLLGALDEPWGLALDPLRTSRVYLAERGRNRILSVEIDTRITSEVVASGIGFVRPESLALERNGARLLAVTQANLDGTHELRAVDLGGLGGNEVFQVFPRQVGAPGFSGRVGDLAVGPDGLRLLPHSQSDRLAIGGGVEQRRRIVAYEPKTRSVTVDQDFDPALSAPVAPTRTWRVASSLQFAGSPEGAEGVFVWDSSDLSLGGEVLFRMVPLDTDIGIASVGAPQTVLAPLQVDPTEIDFGRNLITADVDGDGDIDLVDSGPRVRFQLRPGIFDEQAVVLGSSTGKVAAADLDGDGHIDLVQADITILQPDPTERTLKVYFQEEDGSFPTTPLVLDVPLEFPSQFDYAWGPVSVVAADLDGNGLRDLLAGTGGAGITPIAVYFQRSARVFDATPLKLGQPAPATPLSVVNTEVIAVDLDGDGANDIVAANSRSGSGLTSSLDVYFQTTPGIFDEPPLVLREQLSLPRFLEAADLDGDGDLDLVVSVNAGLQIFLQTTPRVLEPGPRLDGIFNSLAVADADGDGDLDLVLSVSPDFGSDADVVVLVQTPPGIFGDRLEVGHHGGASAVAAADLNGDGVLDLATSPGAIFLQARPGIRYEATGPVPGCSSNGSRSLATGDLDGDGDLDLVATFTGDGYLTAVFQASPGVFASRLVLTPPNSTQFASVKAADLDGDADLDVVAVEPGISDAGSLRVFLQTSAGSFSLPPLELREPDTMQRPAFFAAADLDGDGDLDLATANSVSNNLTVFFQTAAGSFATSPLVLGGVGVTDGASSIAAADLDGDGDLDLVSANPDAGTLTIFFQTAAGVFAEPLLVLGTGTHRALFVTAADLDDDGDMDLVTADRVNGKLALFFQTSSGCFDDVVELDIPPVFPFPPGFPLDVTVVDLDRDGDLDLVSRTVNPISLHLLAFLQTGPGRFEEVPLPLLDPDRAPCAIFPADVDGDGDLDLMSDFLYVLFGGL